MDYFTLGLICGTVFAFTCLICGFAMGWKQCEYQKQIDNIHMYSSTELVNFAKNSSPKSTLYKFATNELIKRNKEVKQLPWYNEVFNDWLDPSMDAYDDF